MPAIKNSRIRLIHISRNTVNLNLANLSVELIVAQIKGRVNGLERFEVNVNSLFLSVVSQDGSTVNNKSVIGDSVIQFQLLLSRCDGTQN